MLAVFAIFAGVTRISARACPGENIERDLIEEKYRQRDLSCEGENRFLIEHARTLQPVDFSQGYRCSMSGLLA